jgi:uncharacterized protein (UPF0276 family)
MPAIGYALRKENRLILDEPALDGVEVLFEHANDPLRLGSHLGRSDIPYVSIHALELSIASPHRPPQEYLEALREVAEEHGAAAVSDHLGFTRDGNDGVGLGHFAPPPFCPETLDVTCRNIEFVQGRLEGFDFFLENIAYDFRLQGTMTEAEFLAQLLTRTGCGWLLDVTNVYANARNHDFDGLDFIRQVIPSARRLQIHLAGGYVDEATGRYVDSHSEPIPEAVWDLYGQALRLGRGRVQAVFIERDASFPDEDGWRGELQQARRIAQETEALP